MKSKINSKVISIVILIILFPGISFSQWKKGDWLAEGSIGNLQFSSSQLMAGSFKDKNTSTITSFNLHPTLGYFVTERIMIGATLGFGYTNLKNYQFYTDGKTAYTGIYRISTLSLIPAIRYYFKTQSVKNKFYVQLDAGAGILFFTKNQNTNYDPSGTVTAQYKVTYPKIPTTVYGQAFIGFNHFITTNIALNSALGYNYSKSKNNILVTGSGTGGDYSNIQTQTSNGTNLFWSLGFTLIIPGKINK